MGTDYFLYWSYLVIRYKKLRITGMYFILNLAVNNLIATTISAPIIISSILKVSQLSMLFDSCLIVSTCSAISRYSSNGTFPTLYSKLHLGKSKFESVHISPTSHFHLAGWTGKRFAWGWFSLWYQGSSWQRPTLCQCCYSRCFLRWQVNWEIIYVFDFKIASAEMHDSADFIRYFQLSLWLIPDL